MHRVHFSAVKIDWETPARVLLDLHKEFRFTYDPCPIGGEDGLAVSWRGERVFCNPPYGPGIRPFLEKWREPKLAVYLLPARTDVKWFHDICLRFAQEVRFLRGRLKFGDSETSAPFASMVVVFGKVK
jgi:hypothetical protein